LNPWGWDYQLVGSSDLVADPTDQGVIESYFKEVQELCQFRYANFSRFHMN
jgi:hypothetical protein